MSEPNKSASVPEAGFFNRARLINCILPAVCIVLGVAFWKTLDPHGGRAPVPTMDKPAPAFELPALLADQAPVTGEVMKDKVTLVSVFASWCIPCRAEHPLLMDLAKKGAVHLVGLDYMDKTEDGRAWIAQFGNPYEAIGVDAAGRAARDFGIEGVPQSFLVDGRGHIRFTEAGPLTEDVIGRTLLPMAAALAKEK